MTVTVPIKADIEQWIQLKSDGYIRNNHYFTIGPKIKICQKAENKKSTISVKGIEMLKTGVTSLVDKYSMIQSQTILKYKQDSAAYLQKHSIRLRPYSTKTTFVDALTTCLKDNSSLVEVQDDTTLEAIISIKDSIPQGSKLNKIWQDTSPSPYPTFQLGRSPLPFTLADQVLQNDIINIAFDDNCTVFNIETLTFKREFCSKPHYFICATSVQPHDLFLTLTRFENLKKESENILETIREFYEMMMNFSNKPDTDDSPGFSIFTKAELEVINGVSKLSSDKISDNLPDLMKFLKLQQSKVTQLIDNLRQTNVLFFDLNVCEDQREAPTPEDSKLKVKEISKTTTDLVVTYEQLSECEDVDTKQIHALNFGQSNVLAGNYLYNDTSCFKIPETCLQEACYAYDLPHDSCCQHTLQNSDNCSLATKFPDFYAKNDTTILISSSNNLTVYFNCSNLNISTTVAAFTLNENLTSCDNNQNNPILNFVAKSAKIFREDGSYQIIDYDSIVNSQESTVYGFIKTLLPYIAALSGLATILMMFVSIYLLCTKKKTNNGVEVAENQEVGLGMELRPRPILRTRTPETRRRRLTTSSSSSESD